MEETYPCNALIISENRNAIFPYTLQILVTKQMHVDIKFTKKLARQIFEIMPGTMVFELLLR